jgi:hypothetical protein
MLFKRRKNIDEKIATPAALKKGIESLNNKLHKFSDYLQGRSEHISLQSKRVGLFVFCLLFGCISICIIIKSIADRQSTISIHAITVPSNIDKSNNGLRQQQAIVSEKEFHRIELFKHYMDSLQKNLTGRCLFDSIMKARPHLIDSIRLLENMYQLQSSKK